ncbi:MAG: methylated-DNA--[protein]-cysteine S-methyltransferase [Candidatus Wallbacteria bacterium]|nr:methylated-DNA--[protein]-cysteine S-methyltransferase [Candidatus Wallbacteria bacterium]
MGSLFSQSARLPPRSKGPEAEYCLFGTALGTCGLIWTAQGIRGILLPEPTRAALVARAEELGARPGTASGRAARLVEQLTRYAAGEPVDFDTVELDLAAVAPFARAVYDCARRIPWGMTSTYGGIARELGKPGAARAIGQALGKNPLPIVVPCHRVLGASGVGGFSATGGICLKEKLLVLEGIRRFAPDARTAGPWARATTSERRRSSGS